ncbi:Sec-independent protein translocase protein TatB [Rhodococcus antarcticus]|uniref:Sec-independent protein translocase protein TatB n=1 Tax=Rhodococcus antarcticus TaxID=2987751 RepID=A0ABY6NX44_9NOCA|nr:Sec-independent protein translocase protein TatB [Rhodococcus antarcticus]UZJ23957.1 Sec-independent protein translocase protein TatB [Rhodococcus antarcticus]
MFGNIGWAEIVVLLFAGLFILGPERLPGAAAWLGKTVKQVREYATGARQQLKDELGPEFDDLRKPLADLQQLRGLNPRAALTKHLFDGDESSFFGDAPSTAGSVSTAGTAAARPVLTKPVTLDPRTAPKPLAQGERPPFDPDAT